MQKRYHTGIGLMRILLSYVVVWDHLGERSSTDFLPTVLNMLGSTAVPCFMLTSFLFGADWLRRGDAGALKKRVGALAMQQIIWTCVYGVIFVGALHGAGRYRPSDVFWQLVAGSRMNPPMWFHVILILLTVLIFLICRLAKDQTLSTLGAIAFIAFALQYAGWNRMFFLQFRGEVCTTLGRICEMLPYACAGILLSSDSFLDRCERNRYRVLGLSIAILIFMALFDVFVLPEGFGYQGLSLAIKALCIVVVFYLIPESGEKLRMPDIIKKVVRWLSPHALGIYCMHYGIGGLLNHFGYQPRGNRVIFCALVFLICLTLSAALSGLRAIASSLRK